MRNPAEIPLDTTVMVWPADRYETADFVIRSWQPGDGEALREVLGASAEHLRHVLPWGVGATRTDAESFVRRARGRWLLDDSYDVGFFDRSGRVLAGGHLTPFGGGVAEIGGWARVDLPSPRLVLAMSRVLVALAFTEFGQARLVAWCAPDNPRGIRLAEALGLTRTGVGPDGRVALSMGLMRWARGARRVDVAAARMRHAIAVWNG